MDILFGMVIACVIIDILQGLGRMYGSNKKRN